MNDRGWATDASAYDAIVIGSGFGGAMAARVLIEAGWSVLMLERGDWVARGKQSWSADAVGPLTRHYSTEAPFRVTDDQGDTNVGAFHCVGGPSVFYGGVALRFRAEDFEHDPEIAGSSGAHWPWAYPEIEPYYNEAEQILGVAGESGADPTEPWRRDSYAQAPAQLAPISRRIERAALDLGYRPFRLPLAINSSPAPARRACVGCGTCDGFACAIEAKNDVATVIVRPLLERGLHLQPNVVVTRILTQHGRATGVEAVDRRSGKRVTYHADTVLLAAGALSSPHLLLASGLHRFNPAGHVVGRYLMRHYNEVVLGVFPQPPSPGGVFHKQLGIHDFYFGKPGLRSPRGKLGGIQQLATPPAGMVRAQLPALLAAACGPWIKHLTGLLVIAEDQPQYENRVLLDSGAPDRYGLPPLRVTHHYSERDTAAGRALSRAARKILRGAGAWAFYHHRIRTFSHAVGTVRMGLDPRTSAVDPDCRFRGVENLYLVDGSVLPTSGGVNPSLTIAANALRTAHRLVTHSSSQLELDHYVASH
jgi:choline dehydrogenase-like flavoprotein